MAFFAQYCENLYKVKLMKMLWYADALAYKQRGRAITGLVYQHQKYGALPIANSEIIYLPQLTVEEIEREGRGKFSHSGESRSGFRCIDTRRNRYYL